MTSPIRIGTRKSPLALWQAQQVQDHFSALGITSVLVTITSEGDANQTTPLYAMGITGVFTKSLDLALLENRIDIAVHSMKDVPTTLGEGLVQAAVLERGSVHDLFIRASNSPIGDNSTIATGSMRRAAQWKSRFPNHHMVDLRGNIQTRLDRLNSFGIDGIIMAAAGIERLGINPSYSETLDWMVPAPAQGAVMVVCREKSQHIIELCQSFNHIPTAICTAIERSFLKTLEGGCTAPIGALATIENTKINFQGVLSSVDGKHKITVDESCNGDRTDNFGEWCAESVLKKGGKELMAAIKAQMS